MEQDYNPPTTRGARATREGGGGVGVPQERAPGKFQQDYNEIDLMDYVRVIFKRKWLILIVFLLVATGTWFITKSMPKVYQIDTALEIKGEEDGTPQQVVERINNDVYGIRVREKLGISEQDYPKIKVENLKDTGLVIVAIEFSECQRARNILEEMNNLILEDYQRYIKNEKKLLEDNVSLLEKNIELLDRNIVRVRVKINSLDKEKQNLEDKVNSLQEVLVYEQTPGTQFALFDTKEKLEDKKQEIEDQYLNINSLENQINSLENQISSIRIKIADIEPIKIVKGPTISENPIKPRPLLNTAIASVLGLFLGTFFAFSLEWWQKNKARI